MKKKFEVRFTEAQISTALFSYALDNGMIDAPEGDLNVKVRAIVWALVDPVTATVSEVDVGIKGKFLRGKITD